MSLPSLRHVAVQVAFIKSFEAVYCFVPLMVKVLFIGHVSAVSAAAHLGQWFAPTRARAAVLRA